MTGIFKRSILDTDLAQMLAGGNAGAVTVHATELDHFKAANDRFGHPGGDGLEKRSRQG